MITELLEPTVRVSSASSSVCVLRTGVRADVDLFLYRRLRADTGRLAVGGRLDLARGVRSGIGGARGYGSAHRAARE